MLLPGDLGFPDLVLVFVFFLFFGVPIAGFVVRRKWRIAAARKEEIKRLIVLASEEAARAELEAAVEYGTVSVTVRQSQCVVCYCPTTTRCSRCKAVRYCSGKCQIIHWRQGHKDECYPPSSTVEFNDDGSSSGQKVDIEGRYCDEPMEAFSGKPASCKSSCSSEVLGKDDDKVELSGVARGTDNISESSDTSFLASFCTSTSPASVSEVSTSGTLDSSDGPLPDDMSHDMLETTANVKDTELTMPRPSESVGLVYPVNSFSSHSKLKHTKPSFSAGEFCSGSTSFSSSSVNGSSESTVPERSKVSSDFWEGTLDSIGSRNDANDDCAQSNHSAGSDDILFDSRSLLPFSFNLSGHAISPSLSQCSNPKTPFPDDAFSTGLGNKISSHGAALSEKMVTDVSGISSSPPLKVENAVSMDNEKVHDSQLLKSKEVKSIPASASEDNPSGIGRQSISSVKPTKLDTVITAATGVSEVASSSPSASNGLKTSVRKVVQQFRPSKLSKHYPLGYGSETAGKYSNKMLFPYEFFVKLYHWDKVELRPCGLTNCGNSCFANAVLQCLAFTRPLTAFLLQGLHSKACPKNEWCFTCEFEGLILKAKDGKSPLSPIGILSQIQSIGSHLGHGREEDAHEFLRYAVDTMQSIFLKEARANAVDQLAEETTLVGLIFGGYLRSKIRCMSCQGKSERHERMMDLTVEIHGDIGTLEEALAQFTATEILDGENKYQCSRCKSYEKAKKKLTVLEAPNVLTIALKRFQSGKFGKLNKSVRFPEILNLAPYMSGTSDKSPIYQLYAVVVHLDVMNAAFSGHYVCYVKNSRGKWFKTDDSMVKPVELERVLSKEAYMLLYARCSPRAPSLSRNVMINDGKIKRLISSHNGKSYIPKPRLNSEVSSVDPTPPSRRARDGLDRVLVSEEGRFYPINGIRKIDSSSDNSSIFSCSDEGSCSTESTRDSISTDELSDYIFGEPGSNWNSPLRVSSDSDGSASPFFHKNSHTTEVDGVCMKGPQESRREDFQGKENHPFLYSDSTREYRNLTNPNRSSSNSNSFRETDSERIGWVDPSNVKSGASLRKLTRDRIVDQTFY